jgi:hypothetical protein
MSVLIKGMQIPKNCAECPVALSGKYCRINKTNTTFRELPIRPDHCPLVQLQEHHGRLIDADYLKEHLYACATNGRPLHRMYQELNDLLEAINDIPTVVEAE